MNTAIAADAARQGTFAHKLVRLANRITGNYFTRRRVGVLVEGADGASVPELLRRARRGETVVAVLSGMVAKGGARGADAAHMVGKLAEEGIRCGEAVGPLKGMLFKGMAMEKGVAALALIRIRDEGALSTLVEASESKDKKVRMAVDVILSAGRAALEDGAESKDPEIHRLSTKLLDRYFFNREI